MVGLAKPTVLKCCHEFVQAICQHQDEFIEFQSTAAEIAKKIEGFNNKSKLPNVAGTIDGSYVPIKAPKIDHEDYFNWKHFYSFLRWRVLLNCLEEDTDRIPDTIIVCCMLHNIHVFYEEMNSA